MGLRKHGNASKAAATGGGGGGGGGGGAGGGGKSKSSCWASASLRFGLVVFSLLRGLFSCVNLNYITKKCNIYHTAPNTRRLKKNRQLSQRVQFNR
jgi:hypothetical protein